ncbi:MAG: transposase family protein [Blastocatellales bacterium]|nr:transposase family protein [Blastocatellales bacterium]
MTRRKSNARSSQPEGIRFVTNIGRKASDLHEHEKELELRHLPICGRQVVLRLRPKRYRCPYCEGGVTTTERLDWYDAKAGCTKAYADFLLLELVNSTIQDVAKKHGVTYDLVRGALTRYVRSEVDWSQIEVLRIWGWMKSPAQGHRDFVTHRQHTRQERNPGSAGRA